jgi:hypothetical protein
VNDADIQTDGDGGQYDTEVSELHYTNTRNGAPNSQQGAFQAINAQKPNLFGNAKNRFTNATTTEAARAASPIKTQGAQRPPTPPNRYQPQQPQNNANANAYGRQSPQEKKPRVERPIYEFCKYCGQNTHLFSNCGFKNHNHPGVNTQGQWLNSASANAHYQCNHYHLARGQVARLVNGVWTMVPF